LYQVGDLFELNANSGAKRLNPSTINNCLLKQNVHIAWNNISKCLS